MKVIYIPKIVGKLSLEKGELLPRKEKVQLTPEEYNELSRSIDIYIESWIRARRDK